MAVGHVTADKRWFLAAAKATVTHKRMSRELMAAAARPGLTAELTASEMRALAEVFPDDELVADAMSGVISAEEFEHAGTARIRARMDRRRGKPPEGGIA